MPVQNRDQPATQDRIQDGVPIGVAAARLGLSVDAVRKRIRRRSIRAYKAGGHWYVVLPASRMRDQDTTSPIIQDAHPDNDLDAGRTELVDQLRGEVAWLREEAVRLHRRLEESETAQSELRRLLAQAQGSREARLIDAPASPFLRGEGTGETSAPSDRPAAPQATPLSSIGRLSVLHPQAQETPPDPPTRRRWPSWLWLWRWR